MKDGWMDEWLKKGKKSLSFFLCCYFFQPNIFCCRNDVDRPEKGHDLSDNLFCCCSRMKAKKNLSKKDFIYELQK